MNNTITAYAEYKKNQEKLLGLFDKTIDTIKPLSIEKNDYLKMLRDKIEKNSFKIQVVGTFKNGKSTFINSFLGENILPAYAMPCTAVINEVKYGEEKKAYLHFNNPLPDELPRNLPSKIKRYIDGFSNDSIIPPIEIGVDEIEDYAVIPMGEDPSEMLKESPYEKIELFWPLEILKNGVELTDSPGLNEHKVRTQVTTNYLLNADAILFVLAADKLCSADEMDFIEKNLKGLGFDNIFFVINRFDILTTERERQGIMNMARQKLSSYTKMGVDGIFFVSALNALGGKAEHKPELYQASGMNEFEDTLAKFLIEEKGKEKLAQPLNGIKHVITMDILKDVIPKRYKLYDSELSELQERYKAIEPKLNSLKEKKEKTENRITALIEECMPDITDKINRYFVELNENIPAWIEEYEPTVKPSILHIKTVKDEISALAEEIIEYAKKRIEDEQVYWQNNTLYPLMETKISYIQNAIEGDVESFYFDLDRIKFEFAGIENPEPMGDIPVWQRVVAAGAGFMVNGVAGAALGGMEGLSKEFVKKLAVQFGFIFGMAFLGLFNWPVLIGTTIVTIISSGRKSAGMIEKTVKEKAAESICEGINKANLEAGEKMIETIKLQMKDNFSNVSSSLDKEIETAENDFENMLEQHKKGQAEIDMRKADLNKAQDILAEIYGELEMFTAEYGLEG